MNPKLRNTTILLIEDNQDDVDLILKAYEAQRLTNKVEIVKSGEAALDYLLAHGAYAGRDTKAQPQLILLDFNLPKQSGLETLKQIRTHELTRFIPVVMLTQSTVEENRLASYLYKANSYIRKPIEASAFRETIKAISEYWLVLNQPLPVRQSFNWQPYQP